MRYHHGRSTHLSRRGQYYESSEDEEDDFNTRAFSFTLSRQNKSLLGSDSGFGSFSEFSEKSEGLDSKSALKASTPDAGVTRHIVSSHYRRWDDRWASFGQNYRDRRVQPSSQDMCTFQVDVSYPFVSELINTDQFSHFEDPNMDVEHFQVGFIFSSWFCY